ncbi:MAG: DUF4339 domain-containing protein [Allorhizobium sp.]
MADWYYDNNGSRTGPVALDKAVSLLKSGSLSPDTLVWTEAFGSGWRKIADVPEFNEGGQPPPLPVSQLNDTWIWCLAAVPLAGYFIETSMAEGGIIVPQEVAFVGYIIANVFLAYRDEAAIKASGRTPTSAFLAAVIVPAYLYMRNRRVGRNQIPLLAWFASFAFSLYAAAGFTMPYLGLGAPTCTSPTSIAQVKDLFPQLPINVLNMAAQDVINIGDDGVSGIKRSCTAEVVTSAGATIPVQFTIEDRSDGYYYYLTLR